MLWERCNNMQQPCSRNGGGNSHFWFFFVIWNHPAWKSHMSFFFNLLDIMIHFVAISSRNWTYREPSNVAVSWAGLFEIGDMPSKSCQPCSCRPHGTSVSTYSQRGCDDTGAGGPVSCQVLEGGKWKCRDCHYTGNDWHEWWDWLGVFRTGTIDISKSFHDRSAPSHCSSAVWL